MAKIQRYQRGQFAGVKIPQTDFASLRQATTSYGAIGEMFGEMADFVNKKAEEQAIQRGTRRVSDFGAQETLRQIAEQGGPANVEERQAYAFANKIASSQLESQAINEMSAVIEEARLNKTPVNDVKVSLEAISNGYTDAYSEGFDPETALVLRQNIMNAGMGKLNSYNSFFNDLQMQDLKVAIDTASKIYINEAMQDMQQTGNLDRNALKMKLVDAGKTENEADQMIVNYMPEIEKIRLYRDYENLTNPMEQRNFLDTAYERYNIPPLEARSVINSLASKTNKERSDKTKVDSREIVLDALQVTYQTGWFDEDEMRQALMNAGNTREQADSLILDNGAAIDQNIFLHGLEKLKTPAKMRQYVEDNKYFIAYGRLKPVQQRKLLSNVNKLIAGLEKQDQIKLDAVQTLQKNEIDKLRRQYFADRQKAQENYLQQVQDGATRLMKTGAPLDLDVSENHINTLFFDPNNREIANNVKKLVKGKIEAAETFQNLSIVPDAELIRIRNEAQANYMAVKLGDVTFNDLKTQAENLEKPINEILALRRNDPAQAAFDANPSLKDLYQVLSSNLLKGETTSGSMLGMVNQLVDQMDLYYNTIEAPNSQRRYLPNNEAVKVASSMNQLAQQSLDGAPVLLRSVVQSFGDKSEVILNEIHNGGLNDTFFHAMRFMDGDEKEMMLATRIIETMQIEKIEDETKNLGSERANYTNQINSLIQSVNNWNIAYQAGDRTGVSASYSNAMLDISRKMMLQLKKQNMSFSDAREYVIENFYPEDAIVVDHVIALAPKGDGPKHEDVLMGALNRKLDQFNIPIPEARLDVFRSLIDQRLQYQPEIDTPTSEAVDSAARALWYRDLRSNSKWINNETGDGYILVKGVTNTKVFNASGDPVEIKYKEIDSYYMDLEKYKDEVPFYIKTGELLLDGLTFDFAKDAFGFDFSKNFGYPARPEYDPTSGQ